MYGTIAVLGELKSQILSLQYTVLKAVDTTRVLTSHNCTSMLVIPFTIFGTYSLLNVALLHLMLLRRIQTFMAYLFVTNCRTSFSRPTSSITSGFILLICRERCHTHLEGKQEVISIVAKQHSNWGENASKKIRKENENENESKSKRGCALA